MLKEHCFDVFVSFRSSLEGRVAEGFRGWLLLECDALCMFDLGLMAWGLAVFCYGWKGLPYVKFCP